MNTYWQIECVNILVARICSVSEKIGSRVFRVLTAVVKKLFLKHVVLVISDL